MKYLKQLFIILGISFIGELLAIILPLSIPASIYGLVLLLLLLHLKIVKLKDVEETATFLLLIMPIFFIEPSVALKDTLPTIKGSLISIFVIGFLSFVIVFFITGRVAQFIIRKIGKRKGSEDEF
ncbi:MAG: CidA/LrgA family protein [Lachnospiraceae bacterium]